MKTITKTALTLVAITFSAAALAHYSGHGRHAMMSSDNPHYQEMLERRNNPEAMRTWMQSMRDNPEAMYQWMEKMHANMDNDENFGHFGCHHHRHTQDNTGTESTENKE